MTEEVSAIKYLQVIGVATELHLFRPNEYWCFNHQTQLAMQI